MATQTILMGGEEAEDPLEILKNLQMQEQIDQAMLSMQIKQQKKMYNNKTKMKSNIKHKAQAKMKFSQQIKMMLMRSFKKKMSLGRLISQGIILIQIEEGEDKDQTEHQESTLATIILTSQGDQQEM